MSQRLLILIAGSVLFWLATAIPVRQLGGGDLTLVYSGTSLLLCLVPGIITLVWAGLVSPRQPEQMLLLMFGATGLRLFGVLITAILLLKMIPLYQEQNGFLIWLVVFYLFTLALEMTLLLKGQSRSDSSA